MVPHDFHRFKRSYSKEDPYTIWFQLALQFLSYIAVVTNTDASSKYFSWAWKILSQGCSICIFSSTSLTVSEKTMVAIFDASSKWFYKYAWKVLFQGCSIWNLKWTGCGFGEEVVWRVYHNGGQAILYIPGPNKFCLESSCPKAVPYAIWLQLAKIFLKSCLN